MNKSDVQYGQLVVRVPSAIFIAPPQAGQFSPIVMLICHPDV
jgi:hypothetical protein